jgi:hypothetical protein
MESILSLEAPGRIAQAVWPFRCHLGLHHDELHPVARIVHEKRLAVKVE